MNNLSGEVIRDEVLDTSLEAFGQANYGVLALDIMDNVRRASQINAWRVPGEIHASFEDSPYHYLGSEHELYEPLVTGNVARLSSTAIETALRERLNANEFLFDYTYVTTPGRSRPVGSHHPFAHLAPGPWQKEDLAQFLTHPGPDYTPDGHTLATHSLTGAVGRAFDVLSLVSGVKTDVDPNTTDFEGSIIDYGYFRDYLKRVGITPAVRRNMHDTLRIAVMREILSGRNNWASHDVAVEGDVRVGGVGFSKSVVIDQISVESLKSFAERASNGPLVEAIYDL